MRTHLLLAAAVATGLAGVTCAPAGSDSGDSSGVEAPWAQGAVELFDSVARSLSDVDRHAAASYFSDRGVLDLRAWGGEVHSGRLEIAEALGTILYITPRAASDDDGSMYPDLDVHVDQLFLGTRQAVVRFDAQHLAGGVPWVQLFAVGDDGVASSRLYTESLGHVAPSERWTNEPEHPFYDRYVEVWSSGDPDRLAEVYARSVTVRDAFGRERWDGLDELVEDMGAAAPLVRGPWPEVFRFDAGGRHEQIAVFQLGGSCPSLEARRWVLTDGVIVDETRYPHVPSVRRCEGAVDDGWWTDVDVSGSDELAVEMVVIGGRSLDVVNADGSQVDLIRWLFERFAAGGLEQPDVAAFWFPPSVDCGLSEAIAKSADDRFQGGHTVTLCFSSDELSSGWPGRRWSPHVAHQGLHELAHVWMYDHLDDLDHRVFLARVGLDTWRDEDTFWPERGVEVAAETIAWGLAEDGGAEYLIKPPPDCDELTKRYVMLTGREPLTTCDPTGGG
ncbi:MAG TPA: hypothetical protein VK853_09980 [Ilumatobacteraceae bacterium]|nr:hypothetical protein [Ilumatobacteraceae bacterium]